MNTFQACQIINRCDPVTDIQNEAEFYAAMEHMEAAGKGSYVSDEESERMWETIFRNQKAYRAVRN